MTWDEDLFDLLGPPANDPSVCTPDRALEIGKAAEHLVCADLIMAGYRAFLTDQGLPYDVVVDINGRLLRVQVKSTSGLRKVPQRKDEHLKYMWHVRRAGKGNSRLIGNDEFEILALVAMDIRVVAYMPITDGVMQTVHLGPPGAVQHSKFGRTIHQTIDKYPFSQALEKLAA